LQLKNKLRRTKNINKTTTIKRKIKKAKKIKIETKETKIETKITKTSIKVNTKANTKAIITIIRTTINRKYLLRLRKQFVCIYISLVFKIVLILLNYLLLFNNL